MSQSRNIDTANIVITKIDDSNIEVYLNLAHAYEAEFSALTNKMPDEKGLFKPDTMPVTPYVGFIIYSHHRPVGFCVTEISKAVNDIAEFYIIPAMRKKKLGYILAASIFDKYPGDWQVRQIDGAENAIKFWRRVINKYTENQFLESIVDDPEWGVVTRQNFSSKLPHKSEEPSIQISLATSKLFIQANNHVSVSLATIEIEESSKHKP